MCVKKNYVIYLFIFSNCTIHFPQLLYQFECVLHVLRGKLSHWKLNNFIIETESMAVQTYHRMYCITAFYLVFHSVLTFAAFLVVHQLEAVVAATVEATGKVRADVRTTSVLLGTFVNVCTENSENNSIEVNLI